MVEERKQGNDCVRWGTWEELILGGAVLRHGSHDWDAIALELQTRTLYPCLFTPQVCKAKYEVLQERYSGCSAWVEDLRRKRVNELRRELEKSEESIGSLEWKLETLKSEKAVCGFADQGCSAAEFLEPLLKSGGNESAGKEASRDGSSAASFTQEAYTSRLLHFAEECDRKPVVPEPSLRLEKFSGIDKLVETMRREYGVNVRRKRGKRRRKDLNKEGKEGSVDDQNNLMSFPDTMSPTSQAKEKLTSDTVQPVKSPDADCQDPCTSMQTRPVRTPDADDQKPCMRMQEIVDFVKIFDFVMKNDHASVFRRRLDSQRARYKRIIRQHLDLDTIESRIANKCITSTVQLLRDLLLLANNALVFYSKSTREYKCALILRDLVTKIVHQHHKASDKKVVIAAVSETRKSPMLKPPAKPRSARPFNCKLFNKLVDSAPGDATIVAVKARIHPAGGNSTLSAAESPPLTKKSQGKRGKVGRVKRGNAGIQAETPMKVRKRVKSEIVEL
ncbi:uncharacterized protein LOC130815162 isoform X2 [Amaranthus tricolor]|uniref:uncharacterized protein LOC130815162 isoform X2 n=1 Tax=Amaranthus tricolor TaxID=29722 RepID=UPI00258D401D|nr:uncharacterized protein LOC130815162 isoform X2 [Amaranthus tricolor]